MDLREAKPSVFMSRGVTKKTIEAKGLDIVGERALLNCKDLLKILAWNDAHNINFFRMSSDVFPWMGVHDMKKTVYWPEIKAALATAGEYARAKDHRLTFHPSHFVKLASPDEKLALASMAELEVHSQILDLMGFEHASPYNKINIHVGGSYGDKAATLARWAARYLALSERCRQRVTIENDDTVAGYSVRDLLGLHGLCGVPIVFDFHHHKFNGGGMTEVEALDAAMRTWPDGVTPVVHWSESQDGRKPHAHSDYVADICVHGRDVDIMIEAKCKERALLRHRESFALS
jgi:UV DNA damage endonuclease